MPLEFALRPRIRIREGFAPRRRMRFRLPKFALPILAYWLAAAGITYELIHLHDAPDASTGVAAAVVEPTVRASEPGWQIEAPAVAPALPTSLAAPAQNEPAALPSAQPLAATSPSNGAAEDAHADPPSAADLARDMSRALTAAPAVRNEPSSLGAEVRPSTRSGSGVSTPNEAPLIPSDDAPEARSLPTRDLPAPERAWLHRGESLPSCDAAALAANEEVDLSRRYVTPDLPREAIASVLDDGAWIANCGVPNSTSIEVCVAITSGRVLGVTVSARPADPSVTACVRRNAARLLFPYSSHVDIARTRFAAH